MNQQEFEESLDRVIGKWAKNAMLFYGAFWVIFIITILVLYWKVFL